MTKAIKFLPFFLFLCWLALFILQPVALFNDSPGYMADARNLFDPSYHTIRPVLFPFFLRVVDTLHIKLSIAALVVNTASFWYLLKMASGRWMSTGNALFLSAFFLMTGIWSYCGTCLTETILPSVELWMFISLVRIIREKRIAFMILYAVAICLLGTLLKPWIMLMVTGTAVLLLAAALLLPAFKSARVPSAVLLLVSGISFAVSFRYNQSKTMETANLVMLMVSSGNEGKLRDRLANDKGLTPDSAAFIAALVTDIDTINHKYYGNAWDASTAHAVKYLNVWDKGDVPAIKKGFHLMYFEHFRDELGLCRLSLQRYVIDLGLGAACLNMTYKPELPGLRSFAIPLLVAATLGFIVFNFKRLTSGPLLQDPLTIFTLVVLLASVGFCLFLCLAGANELQRNVLPGVLFQLYALTYFAYRKDYVALPPHDAPTL
ncbi:hypothetical protein [Dinghuibacter silviterrae]|uniref:Uncharacterized protein n=1 Tax=Dinghuibacter silviterrae TaxID=1539049 RepID=A0A4R8DHZ1_9BACT|nr:hypothetical protein [Dinghuibacter silviterrae]TDW97359.1 hypothetical protein EDB95_5207 [Dinghuibacter silviterrae]